MKGSPPVHIATISACYNPRRAESAPRSQDDAPDRDGIQALPRTWAETAEMLFALQHEAPLATARQLAVAALVLPGNGPKLMESQSWAKIQTGEPLTSEEHATATSWSQCATHMLAARLSVCADLPTWRAASRAAGAADVTALQSLVAREVDAVAALLDSNICPLVVRDACGLREPDLLEIAAWAEEEGRGGGGLHAVGKRALPCWRLSVADPHDRRVIWYQAAMVKGETPATATRAILGRDHPDEAVWWLTVDGRTLLAVGGRSEREATEDLVRELNLKRFRSSRPPGARQHD